MTALGKKVLRAFAPIYEAKRMEDRMCMALLMARAEDASRTIKAMNGHAHEHPIIQAWKLKKPSAP